MGWLLCDAIAAIIMYSEEEVTKYMIILYLSYQEEEEYVASQIECTRMRIMMMMDQTGQLILGSMYTELLIIIWEIADKY